MDRKPAQRDPLASLRSVLATAEWVAFDTETTDLGARAEIVELALVEPDGSEYQTLVKPRGAISKGAARVHQIEPAELAAAPPFESVAAEVRRRLARRTVLGYNIDFDRRLLWRELARAGQPAPACKWLCLCDLMTRHAGRRLTLGQALECVGLELPLPQHRAAADARAVVALARALAALEPESDP